MMAKKNDQSRLEAFKNYLIEQKVFIPLEVLNEAAQSGQAERLAVVNKYPAIFRLIEYKETDGVLGAGVGRENRRAFTPMHLQLFEKGKEVGYFPEDWEVYEYNILRHFWRFGKKLPEAADALNAI